jgi:hypothetical protein
VRDQCGRFYHEGFYDSCRFAIVSKALRTTMSFGGLPIDDQPSWWHFSALFDWWIAETAGTESFRRPESNIQHVLDHSLSIARARAALCKCIL